MKKLLIFLAIFSFCLYAKEFKVASYNVENLFDLHYDGTEYKEYKPNTYTWNKRTFHNKIKNISKVINHLNADILALQEIESQRALDKLLENSSRYKYSKFIKNSTSSVGLAVISKYPIKSFSRIKVSRFDKHSRDILKVIVTIENKDLIIYVNHWRSKRAAESKRIVYGKALKNEIDRLASNSDYIILGDLNSNYNEYQTFKYDDKLNDTHGFTAINQVLNTSVKGNFVRKQNILHFNDIVHYNLWLEIDKHNRFSSKYRGSNNTPDNIIVSKGLFDNQNISYVNNSFNVFKPEYLYKKNRVIRWHMKKAKGYSDHLPIYAIFSTKKQNYDFKSEIKKEKGISYLYNIENISDYRLDDVAVIYKNKNIAIIKDNNRAIMIYKAANKLKLGSRYNLTVQKLDTYNGLKEIKKISDIDELGIAKNIKSYYLDGRNKDLFDLSYQNEIVKNLRGIYKKGYLYYKYKSKDKKIKLYFKGKQKRPKDGETITITSGHLGIYKSKVQIIIYSTKDYSY